jgi:hypothetical protein
MSKKGVYLSAAILLTGGLWWLHSPDGCNHQVIRVLRFLSHHPFFRTLPAVPSNGAFERSGRKARPLLKKAGQVTHPSHDFSHGEVPRA